LNRFEKRWHQVNPTWMAAKHRDPKTLAVDVSEIPDNVGTCYQRAFKGGF
jgi:hypothetical protein